LLEYAIGNIATARLMSPFTTLLAGFDQSSAMDRHGFQSVH
jgi:hypothetical protein